MTKRLVDIGQAADILGLSKEAIRKRIKRGTIEAKKDAKGKWLIAIEDDVEDAVQYAGKDEKDLLVKTLLDQIDDLKKERDYYRTYFLHKERKLLQPGRSWWQRLFGRDEQ